MIQNASILIIIVTIGYMAFNVYTGLTNIIEQRNNQLTQLEQQLNQ